MCRSLGPVLSCEGLELVSDPAQSLPMRGPWLRSLRWDELAARASPARGSSERNAITFSTSGFQRLEPRFFLLPRASSRAAISSSASSLLLRQRCVQPGLAFRFSGASSRSRLEALDPFALSLDGATIVLELLALGGCPVALGLLLVLELAAVGGETLSLGLLAFLDALSFRAVGLFALRLCFALCLLLRLPCQQLLGLARLALSARPRLLRITFGLELGALGVDLGALSVDLGLLRLATLALDLFAGLALLALEAVAFGLFGGFLFGPDARLLIVDYLALGDELGLDRLDQANEFGRRGVDEVRP